MLVVKLKIMKGVMAARKQRDRQEGFGDKIPFKYKPPVTSFLQLSLPLNSPFSYELING
jgi:hypothetical protein